MSCHRWASLLRIDGAYLPCLSADPDSLSACLWCLCGHFQTFFTFKCKRNLGKDLLDLFGQAPHRSSSLVSEWQRHSLVISSTVLWPLGSQHSWRQTSLRVTACTQRAAWETNLHMAERATEQLHVVSALRERKAGYTAWVCLLICLTSPHCTVPHTLRCCSMAAFGTDSWGWVTFGWCGVISFQSYSSTCHFVSNVLAQHDVSDAKKSWYWFCKMKIDTCNFCNKEGRNFFLDQQNKLLTQHWHIITL